MMDLDWLKKRQHFDKLIKDIEWDKWNTEQRVAFGILSLKEIHTDADVLAWAEAWLANENRGGDACYVVNRQLVYQRYWFRPYVLAATAHISSAARSLDIGLEESRREADFNAFMAVKNLFLFRPRIFWPKKRLAREALKSLKSPEAQDESHP